MVQCPEYFNLLVSNEVLVTSVRTFDPPENIARSVRDFDDFKRLFQLIFLSILHFPNVSTSGSDPEIESPPPATILETIFTIPLVIIQRFAQGKDLYQAMVNTESRASLRNIQEKEQFALSECFEKTLATLEVKSKLREKFSSKRKGEKKEKAAKNVDSVQKIDDHLSIDPCSAEDPELTARVSSGSCNATSGEQLLSGAGNEVAENSSDWEKITSANCETEIDKPNQKGTIPTSNGAVQIASTKNTAKVDFKSGSRIIAQESEDDFVMLSQLDENEPSTLENKEKLAFRRNSSAHVSESVQNDKSSGAHEVSALNKRKKKAETKSKQFFGLEESILELIESIPRKEMQTSAANVLNTTKVAPLSGQGKRISRNEKRERRSRDILPIHAIDTPPLVDNSCNNNRNSSDIPKSNKPRGKGKLKNSEVLDRFESDSCDANVTQSGSEGLALLDALCAEYGTETVTSPESISIFPPKRESSSLPPTGSRSDRRRIKASIVADGITMDPCGDMHGGISQATPVPRSRGRRSRKQSESTSVVEDTTLNGANSNSSVFKESLAVVLNPPRKTRDRSRKKASGPPFVTANPSTKCEQIHSKPPEKLVSPPSSAKGRPFKGGETVEYQQQIAILGEMNTSKPIKQVRKRSPTANPGAEPQVTRRKDKKEKFAQGTSDTSHTGQFVSFASSAVPNSERLASNAAKQQDPSKGISLRKKEKKNPNPMEKQNENKNLLQNGSSMFHAPVNNTKLSDPSQGSKKSTKKSKISVPEPLDVISILGTFSGDLNLEK
jgi:hypothetical protein